MNANLLTFEQMRNALDAEVAKWEVMSIRRKDQQSPLDKWKADTTPVTTVRYEDFMLYVQEVFVFDLNGHFICRALDTEITNLTAEELKAVKKGFKAEVKSIRNAIKQDQISLHSRLSIEHDLEQAKALQKELLKKKKKQLVSAKNITKEVRVQLKAQRAQEALEAQGFDLDSIPDIRTQKTSEATRREVSLKLVQAQVTTVVGWTGMYSLKIITITKLNSTTKDKYEFKNKNCGFYW